jgi:alkaline phosphatase D
VEFACTSISSPGMGAYVNAMPDLGQLIADVNDEIVWHDPFGHGYTLVTLTREEARADYRKVSTIYAPDYSAETVARYAAVIDKSGVSKLAAV